MWVRCYKCGYDSWCDFVVTNAGTIVGVGSLLQERVVGVGSLLQVRVR